MEILIPKLYVFDFEVTKYDWLCVFREPDGKYVNIWNNPETLSNYVDAHIDEVFIGFNSKHYDKYIMQAIIAGQGQPNVKALNDFIINGGTGWEWLRHNGVYYRTDLHIADIRDDCEQGQSLKSIEGQLGMSIVESSISFDVNHPLSKSERDEMQRYCQYDVSATAEIVKLREDYLKSKVMVGQLAGLKPEDAICMTNAKLTAAMLQAKPKKFTDERKYRYPVTLDVEQVPPDVLKFFNQLADPDISDEILWKSKLETKLGNLSVTYGWGGLHGAIPSCDIRADEQTMICNVDVASLYPNTMRIFGYMSRAMRDPGLYTKILSDRLEAKKSGDKATANALKLVLNTTYGAMKNQYNDLYDPLMARSVCITGQLFMTVLCLNLVKIEGLNLIQVNTDGVMFSVPANKNDEVRSCCAKWEHLTGYELERDDILRIVQKDVSNYIEFKKDGSYKYKGGFLVRGTSLVGAFKVNNDCRIVSKAIIDWFAKGTPPQETIGNCNDPTQFAMIAKSGSQYSECYTLHGDKKIPLQKVNRVFASKDESLGTLYKVHKESGQINKIQSIPDHCLIYNGSMSDPSQNTQAIMTGLDTDWYVSLAQDRIGLFVGKPKKKGKKKMSEEVVEVIEKPKLKTEKKPPMSLLSKIQSMKNELLEKGVGKGGYNSTLKNDFFRLEDIVPACHELCVKYNVFAQYDFSRLDFCGLKFTNLDNQDETLDITLPFAMDRENKAKSPVMAIGSAVTYMRRYLWVTALDIIDKDEIEGESVKTFTVPKTPAQRSEVAKTLTTSDQADVAELNALKIALAKLVTLDPAKQPVADQIKEKTKDFSVATRKECKAYLEKVMQRISEAEAK